MRDPVIKLDPFFTDTRVHICRNSKCKNNETPHGEVMGTFCKLKRIDLDEEGKCRYFELREIN